MKGKVRVLAGASNVGFDSVAAVLLGEAVAGDIRFDLVVSKIVYVIDIE